MPQLPKSLTSLDDLSEVDRLFVQALDHEGDLNVWLDSQCADNPTLKPLVLNLVEATQNTDHFFETISKSRAEMFENLLETRGPDCRPGDEFGPFRVIDDLGKGGTSSVYRAERTGAVFDQTVAIKVLHNVAPSSKEHASFANECQALSRLSHPGITRIIDGGETEDGLLWLAMDLIEGERLDAYCIQKLLPIRERLALCLQLGDALAYAHSNLTLHLDIKPANVIVDEAGWARLTDFGLAAILMDDESPGLSVQALTPAYAAPEQWSGGMCSVQTDIFQFGSLCRHILTGVAPSDATDHNTIPPSLQAQSPVDKRYLSGDLDAILLKAQAQAPEDRYSSIASMLDDLRRFDQKLPISLSERPWIDFAGSLMRRNPWLSGLAALVLVSIAGWAITGQTLSVLYQQERDKAELEARRANAAKSAILEIFRRADPLELDVAMNPGASPWQYLAEAADDVRDTLKDDPATLIEILDLAQILHRRADQLERAERIRHELVDLNREHYGPESLETLIAEARLIQEKNATPDRLLELEQRLEQYEGQDREAVNLAFRVLGYAWSSIGDFEKSVAVFETLMERNAATDTLSANARLEANAAIAQGYISLGELEKARPYAEAALSVALSVYGADHMRSVYPLSVLASLYEKLDRAPAAIGLLTTAIDIQRKFAPEDSITVSQLRNNRAIAMRTAGQLENAEAEYRALILTEASQTAGRSQTLAELHQNLGVVLETAEKYELAIEAYSDARQMFSDTSRPDDLKSWLPLLSLGRTYIRISDYDAAFDVLTDAQQGFVPLLPEGHFIFDIVTCLRGHAAHKLGASSNIDMLQSAAANLSKRPKRHSEYQICTETLNELQGLE